MTKNNYTEQNKEYAVMIKGFMEDHKNLEENGLEKLARALVWSKSNIETIKGLLALRESLETKTKRR